MFETIEEAQTELVGHTLKDDEDNAVYVGRGENSASMGDVEIGERGWLGNPFEISKGICIDGKEVVGSATRESVVNGFETVFVERLRADEEFRDAVEDLAGKPVDCWCQRRGEASPACHGEVIVKWALILAAESVKWE